VKPGQRIRLVRTEDSFTRLKPGDEGTIMRITRTNLFGDFERVEQISVKWDNGSHLSLLPSAGDDFEIIPPDIEQAKKIAVENASSLMDVQDAVKRLEAE
jgi:hypothetical protein